MLPFYHESASIARETDGEPLPRPTPAFPRWIAGFLELARQKNVDPHQFTRADLLAMYCRQVTTAAAVAMLLSAPPAPRGALK